MQTQRDISIFGRIPGRRVDWHIAEIDLALAFPGDFLVFDRLVTQVFDRQAVHIVARPGAVQDIGFKHRVESHAAQLDSVVRQHAHVVLEVLADLFSARVLKQRLQFPEHQAAIKLFHLSGTPVSDGYVCGLTAVVGERQPDKLCVHDVEARGFGINGDKAGSLQAHDPGIQLSGFEDGFIAHRAGRCRTGAVDTAKCCEPAAELEIPVERAQRIGVGAATLEVRQGKSENDVPVDGGQSERQIKRLERCAQVFADLAADLCGMLPDLLQRSVLLQPLRGRLAPDLRHAGNIVDRIPDQSQVVGDAFRRHSEFPDYRGTVENRAGHCVDEGDVVANELCQILVAGRNNRIQSVRVCQSGERGDDIVGFNAVDHEQRQTHGAHDGMQRRNLCGQIPGHGRAVGLVFAVDLFAEGLSGSIEHHGDVLRIVVVQQPAEHVGNPVDRARMFAPGIGEVGHGMERPVQI